MARLGSGLKATPGGGVHATRALHRGLKVLEALNEHNGALISDIARATGLPRTTAFRVLENLRRAGYVAREAPHGRYVVTVRVLHLSHAFQAERWITEAVQPVLEDLSQRLLWPVYLLTLSGDAMLIRATTTYASPLAIDALPPGTRVPLATSAAGKAYLAFCGTEERASLTAVLRHGPGPRIGAAFAKELAGIRRGGYALDVKARTRRNPGQTTSIAVPVLGGARVKAALTLRYSDAAMPLDRAVTRFVPVLRQVARRIGDAVRRRPGL